MASFEVQYFLGANSPGGFYSLYDHLIDLNRAKRVYILKGGPGCGKSTLMRRVAALAREAGQDTEFILCSGDPDSLDAVILPSLKIAIVDGTSPHVVEPKYPGVVEQYVNIGSCYDVQGLGDVRDGIMACMKDYKGRYQNAYRCLGAAGEIMEGMRSSLITPALEAKLAKRARGILSRELPRHKAADPGQVKLRFLSAVTHSGPVCLYSTVQAQCSRIYELNDRYGLAHLLLQHLLDGAVENGYDVVACPDPMAPDRLAHLLIPELSLAFVSSSPAQTFLGKSYRRIRLDTAVDSETLRRNKPRLRFSQKVSQALLDEGMVYLAQAKAIHDRMEALYNPYVNFDQVEEIAQTILADIFQA